MLMRCWGNAWERLRKCLRIAWDALWCLRGGSGNGCHCADSIAIKLWFHLWFPFWLQDHHFTIRRVGIRCWGAGGTGRICSNQIVILVSRLAKSTESQFYYCASHKVLPCSRNPSQRVPQSCHELPRASTRSPSAATSCKSLRAP